jgi:hypothetical protein
MVKLLLFLGLVTLLTCCTSGAPREMVLFDFEEEAELERFQWKCHALSSLSSEHVTHGHSSLKLELYPSEYPGLTPKITDNNWKPYKAFRFDVYNPSEKEISLHIRIDDRKDYPGYRDRFQGSFSLKPGPNSISIPLDSLVTSDNQRKLDTEKICRILIFVVNPKQKVVLWIDYMRLVA